MALEQYLGIDYDKAAYPFGGTLAARLNDTIKAEFGEFRCVTMASLAERTLQAYKSMNANR